MFNNKYKRFFKPTDFSLIIADECHRSINGNSRAVFEYFLGYKLGLTATPKDYIKNIDAERLKATDHGHGKNGNCCIAIKLMAVKAGTQHTAIRCWMVFGTAI